MTEQLHFHFSLSCIGKGNGNPLQCSCLENPRGSGAWWAAVYGVAQSRTRLKRLSSSSSGQTGWMVFLSPGHCFSGLPRWCCGKEHACQCRKRKRCGFDPWVRKIPWRRKCQLTPVFLPGEPHGQRSLAGYSPGGCKQSDTTE